MDCDIFWASKGFKGPFGLDINVSALEELASVNKVTISPRERLSGDCRSYGFRWRITFDSVNKMTEYGWVPDVGDERQHQQPTSSFYR